MISWRSDEHALYSLWNPSGDALNPCNTKLTACVNGMFRCCPVYDISPLLTCGGSPRDSFPSVWHLDIMRPKSQARSKACNFLCVTSCIKGLFCADGPMEPSVETQPNFSDLLIWPAGTRGSSPEASLLLLLLPPPEAMSTTFVT